MSRWRSAPNSPTRYSSTVLDLPPSRGGDTGISSMPSLPPSLRVSQPLLFIGAVALIVFAVDAASAAPFGMSAGAAPAPVGGFAGWILMQQATFYRMLSGAIRAAKADGTAAIGLMGISFAYGVFHAAGPGHGK